MVPCSFSVRVDKGCGLARGLSAVRVAQGGSAGGFMCQLPCAEGGAEAAGLVAAAGHFDFDILCVDAEGELLEGFADDAHDAIGEILAAFDEAAADDDAGGVNGVGQLAAEFADGLGLPVEDALAEFIALCGEGANLVGALAPDIIAGDLVEGVVFVFFLCECCGQEFHECGHGGVGFSAVGLAAAAGGVGGAGGEFGVDDFDVAEFGGHAASAAEEPAVDGDATAEAGAGGEEGDDFVAVGVVEEAFPECGGVAVVFVADGDFAGEFFCGGGFDGVAQFKAIPVGVHVGGLGDAAVEVGGAGAVDADGGDVGEGEVFFLEEGFKTDECLGDGV